MTEKRLEKPETKTCESCGAQFSCGANTEKCWCFAVDLSADALAKLQEDFKSCLCKDCLQKLKENGYRSN
jgi:hypothetical protein